MTNASKVARLRESPGRIEADYVPATFTPILEVAEGLVKLNGLFSMYESVDSRKSCGNLRKTRWKIWQWG